MIRLTAAKLMEECINGVTVKELKKKYNLSESLLREKIRCLEELNLIGHKTRPCSRGRENVYYLTPLGRDFLNRFWKFFD